MADLKVNGITPLDIKLGGAQVQRVYQGGTLVWPILPPNPVPSFNLGNDACCDDYVVPTPQAPDFNLSNSACCDSDTPPPAPTPIITISNDACCEDTGAPVIPTFTMAVDTCCQSNFDALNVDFGASANNACNTGVGVVVFVPEGEIFALATAFYKDLQGTPADPGYYSDGFGYRYWDGTTATAAQQCVQPGEVILSRSSSGGELACNMDSPGFYYMDNVVGVTFMTTNQLWTDASRTTLAPSGSYSDGNTWRFWNGNGFGIGGFCGI